MRLLHVLEKTAGEQVESRVPQGPKEDGMVGVKALGLLNRNSRCWPVNGGLPQWSHEHGSIVAKQSRKKGCRVSGTWKAIVVLIKAGPLPSV